MSPTRSSRRRWAAFALATGLLLAGCSAPGQVKDYNATTEENYITRCVEANEGKDPKAEQMCGCWYKLVTETMSFDEFKKLDAALKEAIENDELNSSKDLESRFPDYYKLITENCAEAGPTA